MSLTPNATPPDITVVLVQIAANCSLPSPLSEKESTRIIEDKNRLEISEIVKITIARESA
jgi:hypothetical protein